MEKNAVLDHYKTVPAIVKAFKDAGHTIRPQSVREWGDIIPELRALQLDRMTDNSLQYDPTPYQ